MPGELEGRRQETGGTTVGYKSHWRVDEELEWSVRGVPGNMDETEDGSYKKGGT